MRIGWVTALASGLVGCSIENTILPGHATDTFNQDTVSAVDILFVVDDSASMAEEQAALASGFGSFIQQLEGAANDFHIAVVSTSQDTDDPNRGRFLGEPRFLTPQDDYVTLFQQRVGIGTGGSDKEKGLQAASLALSPELLIDYNAGFLRADANLLVVLVSDEDDCSDDGRLDGQDSTSCYTNRAALVPVEDEITRIRDAKIDGELVQIAGIIGPFDDSCTDAYSGRRYAEAALQTGGLLGKICDQDWSVTLDGLGLNATGILDQFKLSNGADLSSIVVTVDGVEVPPDEANGWTYDWVHWLIQFHGTSVPPEGSVIVVDYDIAPSYGPPPE